MLGQQGVLQVIPPAQLEQQLQDRASATAAAARPAQPPLPQLAGYIKGQFEIFRNHRNTAAGWSERLLIALRTFNGQYDSNKLRQIRQFGGSEIYARIVAQKARAASSLLRDIYLGQDRPWAVRPPDQPELDPEVVQSIEAMLEQEEQMIQQTLGKPPDPVDEGNRRRALFDAAEDAAKKKAGEQARDSEDRIETMLREGGFYHALAEFLVDLAIFPFACIKGPEVKVVPTVTWPKGGGPATVEQKPKLTWGRVSPFDIWFTPGVADIENANVIEKLQFTRAEINDLLDLPGYNHNEILSVLDEYGYGGLYDNWDTTDAERSVLESRENPAWNRSGLISCMQFNGNVQGRILQDYGMAVPDPLRDYHIQAWCIGSHVIKCNMSPSPRQRHPYFITSFEKVPGTPVGNGLTDLLSDVQEAGNATLRALINNMSIASGPQVVVDDDQLAPEENGEEMYPWKRWHVRKNPLAGANAQKAIEFFSPQMNVQQLLEAFREFVTIADDVSAIPKYVGGGGQAGGAGRTASGLAMLMGNSSKILQTVSANIDRDVIEPALLQLSDLIMLTDTTGLLSGEEKISVVGVNVAIQRETMRQRQIEFLTATNNPQDMKIIGLKGRAQALRPIATTIGLPGETIVPSDDKMEQMEQQEKQQGQNAQIEAMVQKGVAAGVEAGVKRISTELTAGVLAARTQLPEGPGVHLGTLASDGGAAPPGGMQHTGGENPGAGPAGGGASGPAQAQGNQPHAPNQSMGPQTHLTSSPGSSTPGGVG